MNGPDQARRSVLLADLGGTNSRFAVTGADGRPERVTVMANEGLAGPEDAIGRFLTDTGARLVAGVLAVAGPIDGDAVALTNRAWAFRLSELGQALGLSPFAAINDFEAVAWSVPGLGPDDIRSIGRGFEPGHGVKAVCGPGTGLGVAALVPANGSWQVVASEGGHVSFGPASADEEPVFARLREATGVVSAEMVLSGPGLARLHRALHPGCEALASEGIVAGARNGDPASSATIDLFVRLLGRFAGDLALTFKATGGVYLTGGLGCGLGDLLDPVTFRRAFEDHPPHQALLAGIPTFAITHPQPGLLGCAVYAERMMR